MASNNIDDEKPNLRPTKRVTATGKSIFLHHNPNQRSNKSYVHVTLENNTFDNQQPHVEYSLNKQQRWKIVNDFDDQSSLSSEDDFNTQSDSEQGRKKKISKGINSRTTNDDADSEDDDDKTRGITTYVTTVPSSRKKQLSSIRKTHGTKSKKSTSGVQRARFTQVKEPSDAEEQLENEKENLTTDEDELITAYYTSSTSDKLQLNDFLSVASVNNNNEISSKSKNSDTIPKSHSKPSPIYLDDNNSLNSVNRFYRQISKEEKLYNRDMTTYKKKQQENGQTIKPKEKSHHHLMSLSFRTIYIDQSDLNIEYLSKTYGKNFIHAQCNPTKYLICLTDRLKSYSWSNKFDLFSIYSTLNCYLIIILNNPENICQGQVGLNMDLYSDTIEIENLSQTKETIYKIDELINKTIEFITNLSFDIFKPIDSEINQRKYFKNQIDNELSESEFINKQIHQIHLLDKKDLQNEELNINDKELIQPEICTNCCMDMNELTPMTALKSCNHWLCNQCWKQYLENSIKSIKVIRCPEWNCCSVIDVGTILSLVNVRCMNIYERNLEKCLVNLSRSHIKCPLKSCSNIIQINNTSFIDNIRCRCGHQFCIDCKQELHFPATCTSYQGYVDEIKKNGDSFSEHTIRTTVINGRNCISCDNFIEKNGGCNHMTCRCGAEFCWLCTAYWKDHYASDGVFTCPKKQISLTKKVFKKERNSSRRLYEHAIYHRYERTFKNQTKQNDNVKRLIGTIPLDKDTFLNSSLIKSQIDKRETLLKHCYEMVKYINYLHRICEFIAVAADGYANNPIEFSNSLYPLETILFNLSQVLEGGKGYKAIEQLNELYAASEKLIQRIRQAVIRRRVNPSGYITS